jgi:hypothetical protein
MPTDLITRLTAADPALDARLPDHTREAIFEGIKAAPPQRRRSPLTTRRLLVIAILAALAAAGVGVAALSRGGQTPRQVSLSYAEVTRHIPVPPGYKWPGADVPTAEAGVVFAGQNAAVMQATGQATCAWWDYWRAAYSRDDKGTMAAALAGQAGVMAITPHHRPGDSEHAGGADESVFAYERVLLRDARAGRPGRIDQYLKANCR